MSYFQYVMGIALLLLGMYLGACATVERESLQNSKNNEVIKIEELLNRGLFAEAFTASTSYAERRNSAIAVLEGKYYQGRALQGMGRCQEALPLYRQVTTGARGSLPHLEVSAFYESAICFEDLGLSDLAIATLLDLRQRQSHLDPNVAKVEIPARLATEYSKTGNSQLAAQYFAEAQKSMQGLLTSKTGVTPVWLPRTLFYMGYIPPKAKQTAVSSTELLMLLGSNQNYLLRSAELGDTVWSHKAASNIIETYGTILANIQSTPLDPKESDPGMAEVQAQEMRWDLAQTVLRSTHQLKLQRLPRDVVSSKPAEQVDQFVVDLENQLNEILSEAPVSVRLTPEAARQQSPRRKGRVVGPETELERQSQPYLPAQGKDPNL